MNPTGPPTCENEATERLIAFNLLSECFWLGGVTSRLRSKSFNPDHIPPSSWLPKLRCTEWQCSEKVFQ